MISLLEPLLKAETPQVAHSSTYDDKTNQLTLHPILLSIIPQPLLPQLGCLYHHQEVRVESWMQGIWQ